MISLNSEDGVSVIIPKKLHERISEKIRNTSFSSVSEYVTYLLEKEVYGTEGGEVFSEEEEEEIKERLRKLGYL